jgi:hypothetical protein
MRGVAPYLATNVNLPRTSRGHPPRLGHVKQATQKIAELCQFSLAELVAFGISNSNGNRCVIMTTDATDATEKKDLSKELSTVQLVSWNSAISHVSYPYFP